MRGYFTWLGGFLTGDWPNSIKGNREVWPNLKDAMANSLRLGGIAAIIGIVLGCTFGVFAALKPGSLRDGSVNTTALVGLSIPPFVSAVILQMVFAVYTRSGSPSRSGCTSRRRACTRRASRASTWSRCCATSRCR